MHKTGISIVCLVLLFAVPFFSRAQENPADSFQVHVDSILSSYLDFIMLYASMNPNSGDDLLDQYSKLITALGGDNINTSPIPIITTPPPISTSTIPASYYFGRTSTITDIKVYTSNNQISRIVMESDNNEQSVSVLAYDPGEDDRHISTPYEGNTYFYKDGVLLESESEERLSYKDLENYVERALLNTVEDPVGRSALAEWATEFMIKNDTRTVRPAFTQPVEGIDCYPQNDKDIAFEVIGYMLDELQYTTPLDSIVEFISPVIYRSPEDEGWFLSDRCIPDDIPYSGPRI